MIRQSTHSMLSLLIMGLGKALFVLLTANFYGPEGQGIVALGISVMVAMSLFLGLGTDHAATFLVGKDLTRLPLLRDNSTLYSLVSFAVALGILDLAFRAFGDTVFREFPGAGFPALVLLVGLQIYHQQIQGLAVGVGDFWHLAVANFLQHLLLVAGIVSLHLTEQPVVTVLYLWAAGLVVKTAYLLLRLPEPDGTCPEGRLAILRSQLSTGSQMMLGSLTNLLNFRLDAYFIAYFLPTSHLGLYSVAATIAEGTLYLPKAVGQVVFSWASNARRDPAADTARIRDVFLTATYATLLFVLAVQVVLRPLLAVLFGEPFLAALDPARILLVASVAYGIGLVAMNLIYGFGNPGWNTRAGMIAVALNVLGNLFAIPRWGITGAACTSLVSYAVYCLLNLANVGRYLPERRPLAYLLVPDRAYVAGSLARIRRVWAELRQ